MPRTPRLAPFFWAVLAGSPAAAIELALPLACRPGEDCWVVRHVDHDPGPGFLDHRCGRLGSDGHQGSDFAIAGPRRMREGVAVQAAAAGVVQAVRDGVPDQPPDGRMVHEIGRQNCGNGVLIEHGQGWETQYCHLRQGSVVVGIGDEVAQGQPLGLVGMSGEANFPHVHLTVRQGGRVLDPFTRTPMGEACGETGVPLWRAELAQRLGYVAVPIAEVGLTDRVPEHREIVGGTAAAAALTARSPALVGYLLAYGALRGDRIELTIRGPDGQEVNSTGFDVEEDAPRASRSAGRRMPAGGWPAGRYRVEARVARGERSWMRERSFTVDP